MALVWSKARVGLHLTQEEIDKDVRAHAEGTYLRIAANRAPQTLGVQTFYFVSSIVWTVAGRMLIGMGLMKLGVFSGSRSTRTYLGLMLLGYGVGLPLVAYGMRQQVQHDFNIAYYFGIDREFNGFASILVAIAHASALILVVRSGAIAWLTGRLAAVGRMALSNYLTQTLICTTLFYGYGFGLFGKMNRAELFGVVILIWAIQLAYSPIWLKHFRYGPAEWFWRTLTYGKIQPMRVPAPID